MQTVYASSRRIVAVLLSAVLVIFAVLTALRALDAGGAVDAATIVVTAAALVAGALLVAVAVRSTPQFGLDVLAFLVAALAIGVSWGAGALEPGILIYLPALVVAVAFATMALMLRTEAGAALTKDRL